MTETKEYEKKSVEETVSELKSDSQKGLTEEEAKKRISENGLNEIPEKEESFFLRALKRFYGPIPFMIELAAVLSGLLGKWDDFSIILFLLFLNAGIDLWQESKALNALKTLKDKLAKKCLVIRDGKFVLIDAKFAVKGDLLKIKIGDIVAADMKIIESEQIQADQSSLTGESFPVNKKNGEIVFGNSVIKKGEATGIILNTGLNTFFGKTVSLVAKAEKTSRSHLQEAVIEIGKYLIALTLILAGVILVVSLFRNEPFFEILTFVLVLTVAAIPVALPAILSVTLAVGALNLSKKQAIVSRLSAIEELAGMNVICFDKTGTLTQNKMAISQPIAFGFTEKELMVFAGLCSAEEENDPIEKPIFDYLKNNNLYQQLKEYKTKKFVPFNPVDKRTEAVLSKGNKEFTVIKGAIQEIVELSRPKNKKEILEKINDFSGKGMRTLGVAVKTGKKFVFAGIIPLSDPPREDSAELVMKAKSLGLNMKMITGDNILIAKYISGLVGIGKRIVDAQILRKKASQKTEEEKDTKKNLVALYEAEAIEKITEANGFAQVYPEDKYFIVESLQNQNNIVGMTGDGVNDAPALKKADSGISVSGATDAARAAADVILLNPSLSVIIDAIKESRKIFERMKSYSIYRITETVRLILFISASILFLGFYPISPIMIILLLVFNDLPILAIAYDNTKTDKLPVRWNIREVLLVSTALGISGVIASFGALYLAKVYFALPLKIVQTIIFLKLAVAGHSTIYVTRTDKRFWQKPYPAKLLLIAGFGTEIIATLFAVYGIFVQPIGWGYAIIIWLYAAAWFIINDEIKARVYRLVKHNN